MTKVLRAGAKVVRAITGAVRWLVDLWHQADQQATTRGEAMAAPPRSPSPVCPLDLEVPLLMWSSLPSNLRTVLGTALLLGLGVAAAAFTLSFFALRDAAADPALAWGPGTPGCSPSGSTWPWSSSRSCSWAPPWSASPTTTGSSSTRGPSRSCSCWSPRPAPCTSTPPTSPTQVRPLALAVPVASILVTLGLAYLLKMLAAASGAAAIHLAPPALEPNRIVRTADVLHGELVRDPAGPRPARASSAVYGQLPCAAQQQAASQIPMTARGAAARRPSASRSRRTWPRSAPTSSAA